MSCYDIINIMIMNFILILAYAIQPYNFVSYDQLWSVLQRTYIVYTYIVYMLRVFSYFSHILYICMPCAHFSFMGSSWPNLVNGGASSRWEVRVKGNLTSRPDNKRINSSPITIVPPLVRLRHGTTQTITIPGKDQNKHRTILCYLYISHNGHMSWIHSGIGKHAGIQMEVMIYRCLVSASLWDT